MGGYYHGVLTVSLDQVWYVMVSARDLHVYPSLSAQQTTVQRFYSIAVWTFCDSSVRFLSQALRLQVTGVQPSLLIVT